jgi:DNA-binding NtrC family response regulator
VLEVLLVDDDPAIRMSVAYALADAGHRVVEASDGEEALALSNRRVFDVAICDVRLPKVDGLTLFRHMRQKVPSTAIILMTAYATIADAVATLREGAYDYVLKPFDSEEFTLRIIGRIAERRALRQELEQARAQLASREVGSKIVGHSPQMVRIQEQIDTLAQSDAPVLVTGETGTGKELVARTIHARGARRAKPFVAINCTVLDGHAETELFGGGLAIDPPPPHPSKRTLDIWTQAPAQREGGAGSRRPLSRLIEADGGTLFLDDVGSLPLPVQSRLACTLETGAIERSGADPVPLDIRVIASSRDDLLKATKEGRFLDDLYYRLNVLDVSLPPLRERRADLPLLLGYFLEKLTPHGKVPPGIAPPAWTALSEYSFPGNVREFAHAVERALVLSRGSEIDLQHLPEDIAGRGSVPTVKAAGFRPLAVAAKEFERTYLQRALEMTGGKRVAAAGLLGLSRKTLWEKLRSHGLGDSDKDEPKDESAKDESKDDTSSDDSKREP